MRFQLRDGELDERVPRANSTSPVAVGRRCSRGGGRKMVESRSMVNGASLDKKLRRKMPSVGESRPEHSDHVHRGYRSC